MLSSAVRKIARSFLDSQLRPRSLPSPLEGLAANFLSAREFSACIVYAAMCENETEREGKGEREGGKDRRGSQYLSFRRGLDWGGGGRFIRRNSGRNLMQINAGRRGCWAPRKGDREGGEERCCRSFFVDTRRYVERCGEQRRRERRKRARE